MIASNLNPRADAGSNDTIDLVITPAIQDPENLPELPGELIEGVIRRGSKLLVTGASKSGKSFLFIELALAIAEGGKWCGMQCRQGKVLYVNLEIQEPQFMHRVFSVMNSIGAEGKAIPGNFHISNMRGKVSDIKTLVDAILEKLEAETYDLVLIDPTYKVQSGSENNADAITAFCRELDRLVEHHGCTVAYSHHHSKGGQGNKNAEDRASGSGVFARDADAIIDMVELCHELDATKSMFLVEHQDAIPFRLEFVLRDFKKHEDVEVWFSHPVHLLDSEGLLKGCKVKPAGRVSAKKNSCAARLSQLEDQLDSYMGELEVVERKLFLGHIDMSKETLAKILKGSTRFRMESTENKAYIQRV